MTLNQLKVGNSAVITTVGGDGALRCRLLDMGLIPHTRVTLFNKGTKSIERKQPKKFLHSQQTAVLKTHQIRLCCCSG